MKHPFSEDDARSLVATQRQYFESGITRDYHFRIKQLKILKNAILSYQDKICDALNQDLGRCTFEALIECLQMYEEINHIIKHLKSWMKPKRVTTELLAQPGRSRIEYTPKGVVFVMGPYNYPFMLSLQPSVGAMAAGNCVILKPSSHAPKTSSVLRQMIDEYFPAEYFKVKEGTTDVTGKLLENRFDHIFLTGSPRVGKVIMESAAKHLTPVSLELGGKSPTIVHHDCNIKIAAKRILSGKMLNAGQTCVAPDYVFVHSSIKDEFIKTAVSELKKFYGDNPKESTDFGRIINNRHFNRLKNLIVDSKVVVGGASDEGKKYIAPTLMKNVSLDDGVMKEEIFGPILPIMEYTELSEIYRSVRELPQHPLALYLFTSSKDVEKEVLENIQFGGGCINNTMIQLANGNLPFGGVGESGLGSYHKHHSFLEFSHKRSVIKTPTIFDLKWRYPPYKNKHKLLQRLIG